MVTLQSLLNPMPAIEFNQNIKSSAPESSSSAFSSSASSSSTSMSSLSSVSLDTGASHLQDALTRQVNFQPCELRDSETYRQHERFRLDPIGKIGDHPKYIPYKSTKRDFFEKTGRGAIDAFEYTFRMPGESHQEPHKVMWDYHTGLVRITAFFKCLKHPKTIPARFINANSGLRDVSHTITGGAIRAQGYWVPFEAAKAIAQNFCWEIRYALTPIFGLDFPATCVRPEDARFNSLIIGDDVVRESVQRTESLQRYDEEHEAPKPLPVGRRPQGHRRKKSSATSVRKVDAKTTEARQRRKRKRAVERKRKTSAGNCPILLPKQDKNQSQMGGNHIFHDQPALSCSPPSSAAAMSAVTMSPEQQRAPSDALRLTRAMRSAPWPARHSITAPLSLQPDASPPPITVSEPLLAVPQPPLVASQPTSMFNTFSSLKVGAPDPIGLRSAGSLPSSNEIMSHSSAGLNGRPYSVAPAWSKLGYPGSYTTPLEASTTVSTKTLLPAYTSHFPSTPSSSYCSHERSSYKEVVAAHALVQLRQDVRVH